MKNGKPQFLRDLQFINKRNRYLFLALIGMTLIIFLKFGLISTLVFLTIFLILKGYKNV